VFFYPQKDKIRYTKHGMLTLNFNFDAPKESTDQHPPCCHEGCLEQGLYKAPKGRHVEEYYWFCLTHVKLYNAAWDYYDGMDQAHIEASRKDDITWNRPSWPLSQGASIHVGQVKEAVRAFVFGEGPSTFRKPTHPTLSKEIKQALHHMELKQLPSTLEVLKKHYRQLARLYHPDIQQHHKEHEETLKKINAAYTVLKKQYSPPKVF
jgi:DnaJ domain